MITFNFQTYYLALVLIEKTDLACLRADDDARPNDNDQWRADNKAAARAEERAVLDMGGCLDACL